MRVVINADGQLHVVSNTPDLPHQHANPQNVGRVDNLRTPRVEYEVTGRFATRGRTFAFLLQTLNPMLKAEYADWWRQRAGVWRFGTLESGFNSLNNFLSSVDGQAGRRTAAHLLPVRAPRRSRPWLPSPDAPHRNSM
jgi:hypothetical protein